MFSKMLALSLLTFTTSTFAAGNGIERIRFEGGVNYEIAEELHAALINKCAPAAIEAKEIVGRPLKIEEYTIDQGQTDVTYELDVELRLERMGNEAAEYHTENVTVVVTKYSFSNPTVKNTEVHSVSGRACQK